MRRLIVIASLPFALMLAACSPSPSSTAPSAESANSTPQAAAPLNLALGSEPWFAWVGQTLAISDEHGRGPDPGSAEWNRAVQNKLGEEAPQSPPGSPEWQQSVDALVRTRVPQSP